jgi:hypothetical protein
MPINEANIAVPNFFISEIVFAGIRSKETLEQIIKDEINSQKNLSIEGNSCIWMVIGKNTLH